jgi:hypothetical protein
MEKYQDGNGTKQNNPFLYFRCGEKTKTFLFENIFEIERLIAIWVNIPKLDGTIWVILCVSRTKKILEREYQTMKFGILLNTSH